jgi:hypothetical protein
MYKFTYTDHQQKQVVFETYALDILTADRLYKQATAQDVVKQVYIGCSFKKVAEHPILKALTDLHPKSLGPLTFE